MELLHVLNEHDGSPSGLVLPREAVIGGKHWCATTNVFIFNSKGEVLCHQRSLQKERLGGAWMTHVGGHVGEKETYEENARKELLEELGIHHPPFLIPWRTTKITHARLWVREYVTLADYKIEELKPQEGEVEQLRWVAPAEIKKEVSLNPHAWVAGTHHFMDEYKCMRAALVAAAHGGSIYIPEQFERW